MDIGALNHFYGHLKKRKIIRILERICGARMHANYFCPGGVNFDIPISLLNEFINLLKFFFSNK